MALNRKFRKYRGWVAVSTIALIALVAVALTRQAEPDAAATTYSTTAASTGTLSVTVSGTGNLEFANQSEVWPPAAGTVDTLEVAEGTRVKAGDVLFSLDAKDAEAAAGKALASYRQAQSQVAQASAQLVKAQNSLATLQDRADEPTSTVTSADITAAQAEVTSAKASLASAKVTQSNALADYEDARAAEDDLDVVAPCDGYVYALSVAEGDSVTASSGSSSGTASGGTGGATTVATTISGSSAPVVIVQDGPLVATLNVNEVDLPALELGQRADLEFDALPDIALTGKVTDIAAEGTIESGVVSYPVEITLDVANDQLRCGMTASATIVTAVVRNALLVPNAGVKSDDEGSYVQVLDASGQPQRVGVQVGLSGDTQTEVISGLAAGDKVVTASADSSDENQSTGRGGGGGLMMMGGGPGR